MVIILGSPWQAIIAVSYIENKGIPKDSISFMIEKSSKQSYNQILKILNLKGNELKTVFIFEWNEFAPLKLNKLNQIRKSIKKLKQQLLNYSPLLNANELIVFCESNPLFQLIYFLFKKNKTYLKFEDGVLDYLDKLNKDSFLKGIIKKIMLLNFSYLYGKVENYTAFKNVYMFKKKPNVESDKFVSLLFLKENIKSVLVKVDPPTKINYENKSVLLLTQS